MDPFKKHLTFISFVVLPFLLSILVVEAAHHHDRLEGSDHCALCVWQQSGSQAPTTPAPPVLGQIFLLVFIFTFTSIFVSSTKSFPSLGRAPPQNLL
jgi:hypothetical protein